MHVSATNLGQSESTDVRFSIRNLLFLMVPVAVMAAAAGQCIRGFDRSERAQATAAWLGWAMLVLVWIILSAVRRARVEKLAGRTILQLPIYGMNPNWRIINGCLFSAYLISVGPLMLIAIAERAAHSVSVPTALLTAFSLDSVFMAWLTALCVTFWWWNRDIRLCEAGVLWDKRLIRWEKVHQRWDPDHDAVTLYGPDQHGVTIVCDAVVAEERRSAAEALLREKAE